MIMKAKLVIENNGKKEEFNIEINDLELQGFVTLKKQTGYERVAKGEYYYTCDIVADQISEYIEKNVQCNDQRYESANYYSDKTLAENNTRADKLMRQLRRFAVEHRKEELDWEDSRKLKATIAYDHGAYGTYGEKVYVSDFYSDSIIGAIYFDTTEAAQLAIDTFHDELIWYFTEYKDSL